MFDICHAKYWLFDFFICQTLIVMTLIQAGHFFAATADYWGDYAWSMHYSFRRCEQSFWARYDDMTLEAARTLRLLLEIDHSGQIG